MPTGYTAKLMEKGQDFRSFVLTCARGMGACIMQRDDPMDQPPAKQKPSDYHTKALATATKLLARLSAMKPAKRQKHGEELRAAAVASAMQGQSREREEERRLAQMEAQVMAWQPPTSDHDGLKKFMLDQIRISKRGDWMQKYVDEAKAKTPEAYFVEAVSKAARDIKYHEEEHAKEVERTNERNAWIDRLYASLPK